MSRLGLVARASALALAAAVLSGCGAVSLQNIPLPGGADLGGRPYQVRVQFRDVLDLVPQAALKVNNVTVGEVTAIDLNRELWSADVLVTVNGGVRLPANAVAEIKQTTLLGEKYVALAAPTDQPPSGTLGDGAVIPLQRTSRNPEIEEVFGALSMLLNGGGVAQLQSISRELNKALAGNEADIKALLDDLNLFVGTLDSQRGDIVRALDGLNRLSANLAAQRDNLDLVLRDLEPGLAVLNQQRSQLVGLLEALDRLSVVAVDVVNRSRDDLVADLEALRPTLEELADTGDDLPDSLEILVTVPFTDSVQRLLVGDYANIDVHLDLRTQTLLENFLTSNPLPVRLPDPLNPLQPPTLPSTSGPIQAPPVLPGQPLAPVQPGPDRSPVPGPAPQLPLPGLGGGS